MALTTLATNYDGIEQLVFIPVIVLSGLVGFIALALRARWVARFCAIPCALAAFFALSAGYSKMITRGGVAEEDRTWGYSALAVAIILVFARRPERPKRP